MVWHIFDRGHDTCPVKHQWFINKDHKICPRGESWDSSLKQVLVEHFLVKWYFHEHLWQMQKSVPGDPVGSFLRGPCAGGTLHLSLCENLTPCIGRAVRPWPRHTGGTSYEGLMPNRGLTLNNSTHSLLPKEKPQCRRPQVGSVPSVDSPRRDRGCLCPTQ